MAILLNQVGQAAQSESTSTDEWEHYLGEQFRAMRIRAGFEQAVLAGRADVSIGAIKNLESGKGSSLKTLIKVARSLGRTDWLASLAPPVSISPMQLLTTARRNAPRQRVSKPRALREDVGSPVNAS